ncbi:MAG: T9SS type A sorting domain-containing protein [Chitinophagales bacterium]
MKHYYKLLSVFFVFLCNEMLPVVTVKAQATVTMALGYRRSFDSEWIGYNAANVIRDSMYLTEPHLLAAFPQLQPKTIRYPAGNVSNWWDWKKGWFVDSPELPQSYAGLVQKNNGLDSLKKMCDSSGAVPIFCLNMVSSTLKSQLRMLDSAIALGLTVKYAELGNEFYLAEESDSTFIYSLFPSGADYGIIATNWCDSIHKYHPEIKVAAQGAFNRNSNTRRSQWDTSMYKTLQHEDVISFHSYFSAGPYADSLAADTFTLADVPQMLYRPFKMFDILATKDMNLVPPGKEIWITEYNLQDHNKPVHGSWAHGLFLATQTLQYLNDYRITHLACHAMNGTAVYGMFFNTRGGFHFGGFDGLFVPPPFMINDTTQYWGLTAAGRAMKTLGIAIEDMKYVSPLQFKDAPLVTTTDNGDTVTFPSMYGWMLTNDTATHAIVINLSNSEYALKTRAVFPTGGSLVEYYADPTLYVDSESNIRVKNKTIIPFSYNCEPYSITYMRSTSIIPPPLQVVNVVVNGSTTICENDSVELDAGTGFLDYEWSTGEVTQKIWAKDSGIITVGVRSVKNSFQVLDSVHITTLAAPGKPKIDAPGIEGVCEGGTAVLEVKNPEPLLTYTWSNGTGGLADTISSAGDYYVTAINATGCKSSSDITTMAALAAPVPVISPANPAPECFDVGVTLDAGADYKSYTWNDGSVGQIETFNSSGSYSVTVKDSNKCYGTSALVAVTIHEPADPVITVQGPVTFCSDTLPTALTTVTGYIYEWSKAGNIIAGATDFSYYPDENGTYKVTITDAYGCTKKSEGVTITVINTPNTNVTLSGPSSICEGVETTTLNAKDCADCTFQWMKNDVDIAGATSQSLTVTYAGDYNYVAINSGGCSAVSEKKTVSATICRIIDSTATEDLFSIYPNPAASFIHVRIISSHSGETHLHLMNALGEDFLDLPAEVKEGEISEEIAIGHLPNGIYLLVKKSESEVITKPFIINR